jgi:hypothetical protein
LTISNRDLADLASSGLLDIHKEKLDGQDFLDVGRLLQKALANETRLKESKSSQKTNEKSNRPIYYVSDYSDNAMGVKKYMLLNLHGRLMTKQILVLLSNRPIRVSKMK